MTSYLKAGDTIGGRYEVVRAISAGGMGAVYLAEQTSLGREVAIKVILDGVKDPEMLKRFDLEARAVCLLKHPNIITYHDYGRDENDNPYIVMEFLAGFPASQLFDPKKGVTLEALAHVASQVCSALGEAHRKKIVHRDLKWTNIMVCPQAHDPYFAKLIDFGIVKVPAEEGLKKGITQTGMLLGTPQYMAPEAIQGKKVDGRADQYSLAVMLWEGIEGRKPFDAESMFEIFRMHVQEPIPPIEKGRPLLANYPGLEGVIYKGMAKNPDDRYPSILDFQAALLDAMGLATGPTSAELAQTSLPGGMGGAPASRRGRGATGLQPMDTRLRTSTGAARSGPPKWALFAILGGILLAGTAGVLAAVGVDGSDGAPIVSEAGAEAPPVENPDRAAVDKAAQEAAAATAADEEAAKKAEIDRLANERLIELKNKQDAEEAKRKEEERLAEEERKRKEKEEEEARAKDPLPASTPPKVGDSTGATRPPTTPREVLPKTRKLTVNVRPWGNVSINGKEYGQAPINDELATEKVYRIVAVHPSLGRKEQTIRLKGDSSGKAMTVMIDLSK